jgi:hypothetical protein
MLAKVLGGCCEEELVMGAVSATNRPVVSVKSGSERSGIDGIDKDVMAGIVGIMSRVDS